MGEAAKISLKAIGKQDTYLLSKDPDDSFFNYKDLIRHSEFRKYHRSRNIVNPGQVPKWPLGQTLKVEFNPTNMGDLLSNMWLSITLPGITDGNYADQVGRHILKSVTMFVDDLEVEKLHDDWGIIYDELYLEMSEKVANRFLVNRNLGYDASVGAEVFARSSTEVVIPLHFFFSRKYASDEHPTNKPNRPYFPICSIHKQKILFELEFHNQEFFTNTTDTLELQSFNLVTEEITLSGEERQYFASKPHTLTTDIVKKHPVITSELNNDSIKNNLVPSIPVKCFHWFLRNQKFENAARSVGLEPTLLGKIIDGTAGEDKFGRSVSISGDGTRMAIGGSLNDAATEDTAANRGHVKIYEYNTTTNLWVQLGSDIVGTTDLDQLGFSVSLSNNGSRVAIGSPHSASDKGHVEVYDYSVGSGWTQTGSDIVGATVGMRYGYSVDLSSDGTHVAIGAPFDDTTATDSGLVNVYKYDSGWTKVGADIVGAATLHNLGTSVSLSSNGTLLAVGIPGNGQGSVKSYTLSGTSWIARGSELFGEAASDKFGTSVSLSSDGLRVVVGAPENDTAGHVQIFSYSGSAWSQMGTDINGAVAGDKFGTSVSFSGDGTRVAVGSPGSSFGDVKVYVYKNTTWTKLGDTLTGSITGDQFGSSVSLSSTGLRIGVGPDVTTGDTRGYAYAYALETSEEEKFLMHNRFNFSSSDSFDENTTFFNPVLDTAQFFIYGNKLPNVSNTNHNYFKYLVPHRNRLARPIRNIYTYSFSMNPINVEPSGNLDFSSIESDKTVFEVKLDTTKVDITKDIYTLQMYYTGYYTFKFNNGFMSSASY
tara:strand:+ start:3089 stop:5551 length:2463 start_codon:yes stop_codon:yes gene_type:complete